jgi:hypothetical protein
VAEREPSFWDYVKGAFFARKRVPLLGYVPFNVLALLGIGVAGLAAPGLLLVGAGLEVGYLTWLSQNERFRNLVRGDRLRASALTYVQRIQAVVSRLSPEGKARWQQLARKCDLIKETGENLGKLPIHTIDEMQETGLNSLLMIHARLLLSRETVVSYMKESSYRELQSKLADAETRLQASPSEAVKRSLESNLEILRKRIQHHQNARENLQVVDAELERIENQVDLIREEVAVSRDPTALSARIDSVASSIGEANQFLKANELLLGDLGPDSDLPPALATTRTEVR